MPIRTIRMLGRVPFFAKRTEGYFSAGHSLEAAPFYSSVHVSVRIWGSHTSGSQTDSIDETQSITCTRIPWAWAGSSAVVGVTNLAPAPGSITDYTDLGGGILDAHGSAWAILDNGSAPLLDAGECYMLLDGGEVLKSPFDIPFAGGNSWAPDPKNQRLKILFESQALPEYTVNRTGGSPATYPLVVTMPDASWTADPAVLFPALGRGGNAFWTLFGSIDTSAWVAADWRDFRGVHSFPATPFAISGNPGFQVQATLTLS